MLCEDVVLHAREAGARAPSQARCLDAGIASVTGDIDAAVAALRSAAPALDDAGMILMRTLADDALGSLLGGDEGAELVRAARDRLRGWRVDRDRAVACTLPISLRRNPRICWSSSRRRESMAAICSRTRAASAH